MSKLNFIQLPYSYFFPLMDPHVVDIDEFLEYTLDVPFYFSHSICMSFENSSLCIAAGSS